MQQTVVMHDASVVRKASRELLLIWSGLMALVLAMGVLIAFLGVAAPMDGATAETAANTVDVQP